MAAPKIPLADWVNSLIAWVQTNLDWFFGPIKLGITGTDTILRHAIGSVPAYLLIIFAAGLLVYRRRLLAALIVAAALGLIANIGLWQQTVDTLSLVTIACSIAVLVGIPMGILISEFDGARALLIPLLDLMQATPAFVYLIPTVLIFGIGVVPGVLATAIFSLPPVARAIALGLDEVSPAMVEAALASGASRVQLLWKVKFPLARRYVQLGINQCIMMALSMVVVSALIGARGLGVEVITALTQFKLAQGIEAGVAVVLLAVVLDSVFAPRER